MKFIGVLSYNSFDFRGEFGIDGRYGIKGIRGDRGMKGERGPAAEWAEPGEEGISILIL